MHALKVRVENGRYVVDQPADLPDGTELYLIPAEDDVAWLNESTWGANQRAHLEAALQRGSAEIAAGNTVDAKQFLAKLPMP